MAEISRRDFLRIGGAAAALGAVGFPGLSFAAGSSKRVVVVGGGIGGATAAKYIRLADPSIEVTLIEPKTGYYTCFMSNEVIVGQRKLETLAFGYDGLKRHGVSVVHDRVSAIDPHHHRVTTAGGRQFEYDRCIVSPGVDFRWDAIEGYSPEVAKTIPYAYEAGPQTTLMRKQLEAMRDGGTVIIVPPTNPYRCPPGPYERASEIAWYLQHNKPRSKVLILDPKDEFEVHQDFFAGWKRHYGYGTDKSMIDWVSRGNGGHVTRVDPKTMTLTATLDTYKGDVINIIPPQKAGKIAFAADLTDDSGWCPVTERTFESTRHADIHVIGDSSIATPLPKSGYSANVEAKVCAAAVVALLNGKPTPDPTFINTCYALITPDDGFSVAMVYRLGADGRIQKVKGAGGLSPTDEPDEIRKEEAVYDHSWFRNITQDVFA